MKLEPSSSRIGNLLTRSTDLRACLRWAGTWRPSKWEGLRVGMMKTKLPSVNPRRTRWCRKSVNQFLKSSSSKTLVREDTSIFGITTTTVDKEHATTTVDKEHATTTVDKEHATTTVDKEHATTTVYMQTQLTSATSLQLFQL